MEKNMDKFHHLLWGGIFFLIFYFIIGEIIFVDGPNVFLSLLICLLYSLLPDLDLKNSWIKTQFNNIVLYLIIICLIIYFATTVILFLIITAILIITEIILQLLKHRGLLHSPIFGILLATPLLFINYPSISYFIAGCIGIISHWIVDKFKNK
jgi:hypothetical protein